MAFEQIENAKPVAGSSDRPSDGLRVEARHLASRNGGPMTRYIKLQIGALLARNLKLSGKTAQLSLAFGTGVDAGRLRIAVDLERGTFTAKRDAKGRYSLTINSTVAQGRFRLDFPTFALHDLPVTYNKGEAAVLVCDVSRAMLAEPQAADVARAFNFKPDGKGDGLPGVGDGMAWCTQCEMRIERRQAEGCKSRHCSFRKIK